MFYVRVRAICNARKRLSVRMFALMIFFFFSFFFLFSFFFSKSCTDSAHEKCEKRARSGLSGRKATIETVSGNGRGPRSSPQ
ncbi:hypothetical protein PUN28_005948 [Cardiocondyla obscurior]|uniref:Secreted protein n=1 Tax=Cardiocondyla obscurior TaxID=286306 RepID=A0AAW2GA30_9HYME